MRVEIRTTVDASISGLTERPGGLDPRRTRLAGPAEGLFAGAKGRARVETSVVEGPHLPPSSRPLPHDVRRFARDLRPLRSFRTPATPRVGRRIRLSSRGSSASYLANRRAADLGGDDAILRPGRLPISTLGMPRRASTGRGVRPPRNPDAKRDGTLPSVVDLTAAGLSAG